MVAYSAASTEALSNAVNRCYRDIADPSVRAWIVPLHVRVLQCVAEGQLETAKTVRGRLAAMCASRHIGLDLILDIERRAMDEMAETGVDAFRWLH